MTIVPDYRGHRLEINAIAVNVADRWNAEVCIRGHAVNAKPHVEIVTCHKLTADHAERAGESDQTCSAQRATRERTMTAAIYAHREARRSTAQTARGLSPPTAVALGSHRPPRHPHHPDRREGAWTAVRRLRCLTPRVCAERRDRRRATRA